MNAPITPRTDLVFLRRRIKPGAVPATPPAPRAASAEPLAGAPAGPPAASPSLTLRPARSAPPESATAPPGPHRPSGLVLGGTSSPSSRAPSSASPRAQKLAAQRQKATHEDHEVHLLFPAPGIADVYELNFLDRVLRLSPLQSSVGTLLVSASTAVAWESVRHVTGAQTVDGHKAGTPVMTAGNRELVGYQGPDALITLRHVRELRRAIFINRSQAPLGVRLISGDTVALPPPADGTQMVLLIHRIGNVLELRAEPVPHEWSDLQIWQEFDFSMTHRASASAYGR